MLKVSKYIELIIELTNSSSFGVITRVIFYVTCYITGDDIEIQLIGGSGEPTNNTAGIVSVNTKGEVIFHFTSLQSTFVRDLF